MNRKIQSFFLLVILISAISCNQTPSATINIEEEKAAILAVINNETKAAFQRDYEGWKDKWIHREDITKTYINFADNTMSESLGWEKINDFVRTYIEEHPEPDPLPDLVNDIKVQLYGNGAWVIYEQKDAKLGIKRETRLMEKENGKWKIAGMHTTIYGMNSEQ